MYFDKKASAQPSCMFVIEVSDNVAAAAWDKHAILPISGEFSAWNTPYLLRFT
jgi:hypothetical protein